MELETTTARLVAAAIRQRISRGNIRFGLLARSLPPFDTYTLYESLKPDWANLRLALIGFENTDRHFSTDVATEVEQAVAWRNDANITGPLVIILNSAIQQEKIHSLELLEPFTDQHLRRAICQQGEREANANSLEKRLWHDLNIREITNSIPLVASQVAALYHTLQQKSVADSLPCINLLPDPQLKSFADSAEKFRGRLKKNRETVEWLLALDNQAYRTMARALPTDGRSPHSDTFQKIKQYTQSPTLKRLNPLTLDDIIGIREAKKAPEQSLPSTESVTEPKPSPSKPQSSTPDLFLVGQLLNLNPSKSENQQRVVEIEAQAERISEMFYDELTDNYETDRNREKGGNKEERYEVLIDPQTNEEFTSIKIPTEEEELHPLDEYMGTGSIWIHPQCWGGYINVEQLPDGVIDVNGLFDGSIALPFTPLQPLDTQSPSSLLTLFSELEEQIAEPTEIGNLTHLLKELSNYRRYLTNYRRQFLYYPNWAIQTPNLQENIANYLMTYNHLAQRLQQVCRQAQAIYPDAIERAVAQFLALDVVVIDLPDKEKPQSYNVILTVLHPLHLWKWLKLGQLLQSNQQILTEKEKKQLHKAVQSLPTLLNTFLLHRQMFDPPRHLTEPRLVLAGEINNPRAKETAGIPYYKPVAHESPTIDGLKQFVELFNQFLVLYPPACLGLTLVLIDPPQLSLILNKLADLHDQDILHGVRVYVYHTDERAAIHDDWQAKDDEALQLFRENQQWTLSVNLECHTILEINQQMRKEEIFPHIILLCDPSEAVVQSTFRTIQEDVSPFGVPVQLTYDRISDTIKLIPLPTGGIFDAYAGVRNALTGELQRSVMGVGNRSVIKPKDLSVLLDSEEGANWLTIIDRPHGTLELPSDIGRRLAWQFSASRILAVHTNERDWEQHWELQLNHKLSDLGLPQGIEANYVLNRLLELFPVLPDGLITLIKKSSYGNFSDAFNEDELNQFLIRQVGFCKIGEV